MEQSKVYAQKFMGDSIIFIANGSIREMGTYEELMRLGGQYARMFDIQSYYYKKGVTEEEMSDLLGRGETE